MAADKPGAEDEGRVELEFSAGVDLIGGHGLDPGRDSVKVQLSTVAGGARHIGPQILAREIGSVGRRHIRDQRGKRENVGIIEAAVVDVPVVGAKGSAGQ